MVEHAPGMTILSPAFEPDPSAIVPVPEDGSPSEPRAVQRSEAHDATAEKGGIMSTLRHIPDKVLPHGGEESLEQALLRRLSSETVHQPAPAGPSYASLMLVGSPSGQRKYRLDEFPITVGSSGVCDITLPDLRAEHARILYSDGRFVLYNLTGYEDTPAAHWVVVESGDEVALGPHRLRLSLDRA
jgi:hypothetical protein